MRGFLVFLFGFFLAFGALAPVAYAQVPGMPTTAAAPAKEEPKPEEKKLTDEELNNLVKTLDDPAKRDEFLNNLKALQTARTTLAPEKPVVEPPSVVALDALGKVAADAGENFSTVVRGFADMSQASRWFERQWGSEKQRMVWVGIFIQAIASLAIGGLIMLVVDFLMRRPRAYLAEAAPSSIWVRLLYFVGYHLLAVLPVVGLTVASLVTLNSFDMPARPEKAVTYVIYAFISMQILVWILRMIFAPRIEKLRFLPLDNESAAYLYVWSQRLAGMIVFGFFLAQAALMMDMPAGSVHAFAAFIGLVVTMMVIIIVLQNRQNVATWLRGKKAVEEGKINLVHTMRLRFADVWHIVAIVYLAVGFLIATLDIENGFTTLLRATIITVVTIAVFRFLLSGLDKLMAHGFALPDEWKRQFPGLEERTNSYLPILQRVIKGMAWIIALLVFMSAWGIDTAAWFSTPFGKKVLASSISILLTLFFSVVFWEMVSSLSDRYIMAKDASGRTIERSARMRTLMPLIRHALHIVIVIIAALIILSELGVDITPLLAGAGIIGLALGFGSQSLVKDFMTGLFILLEDTIAVGDVVRVDDHSGVVEEISIRTVRLRDLEGAVHSIPFGEVKSIINMTKFFSYALVEIGVSYDSDIPKVLDIMRKLGDELYDDPAWKGMIYEPMEILGVERYDAYSIAVRGRIKTAPGKQWGVKRAYLLRIKAVFDKEGIIIPFPTTMAIASLSEKDNQELSEEQKQALLAAAKMP